MDSRWFKKLNYSCEKVQFFEGAKNELKIKKMRTDRSFLLVRVSSSYDQKMRGKHQKYWKQFLQ